MKKFLSIFLPSLLVVACFLWFFPLTSLAETWFDNEICWSILSGSDSSTSHVYSNDSVYTPSYSYSNGTSWTTLNYNNFSSAHRTQLPSPFANLSSYLYQPSNYGYMIRIDGNGSSTLSYNFSGQLNTFLNDMHLSADDYFCFCQLFFIRETLYDIHYSFGNIVTGNSFSPYASIDERFLVYNNGVSGMTTSSIINTSLWSLPSSGSCAILAYFNIKGSDLLNYSNLSDLNSIVISLDFPSSSSPLPVTTFEPLIYKTSLNGDVQTLTYLNSIDDNVQIISDVVQQGSYSTPPSSSDVDFSSVNSLDDAVADFNNNSVVWNDLGTGFNGIEITSGLAWVGVYIASYYGRIPFLSSIFAVIIFFKIAQLLTASPYNKIYRSEIHNTEIHNEIKQARIEEHAQTHGEASINDFYGH